MSNATTTQAFTSAKTSLNQIPALFRRIRWIPGTVNLDMGGGRYDTATDWLCDAHHVLNAVYDPYNRTPDHNAGILAALKAYGGADTATCANVLNVIPERACRRAVLDQIRANVKPGGLVFFSVYEGDRSGRGRQSKADCWQNNRPTKSYLNEIRAVFPDAAMSGRMIVATA